MPLCSFCCPAVTTSSPSMSPSSMHHIDPVRVARDHPAVHGRAVGAYHPDRIDALRLAHARLRHDHARPYGADAGLHTGELPGFERTVGVGEHHYQHERPGRARHVLARIVVKPLIGVFRAVGQHQANVGEQSRVVEDRGARPRRAQVLRHRDRHVDGQRVDVRNGRQHPELRAWAHVVAHVCRGVGDDTVDGRAKLRIADVHAGAAEGSARPSGRWLRRLCTGPYTDPAATG